VKRFATIAAVLALTLGPAAAQDAYHIARFRNSGVVGGFGPSETWVPPFAPSWFVPPAPVLVVPQPVYAPPPPPPVVYAAPPPPPVVYAAPPPPPPPPICVVNLPPRQWLNLRVSPNGPILGAMPPGTPMALFNVVGNWGLVQPPRGPVGWAFMPFLICR
jgi:hypothetical protein